MLKKSDVKAQDAKVTRKEKQSMQESRAVENAMAAGKSNTAMEDLKLTYAGGLKFLKQCGADPARVSVQFTKIGRHKIAMRTIDKRTGLEWNPATPTTETRRQRYLKFAAWADESGFHDIAEKWRRHAARKDAEEEEE